MKPEEMAKLLNVAIKTIYNWKKTRPELMEVIKKGLGIKENNVNITINKKDKELNNLIKKLNEKEKELYILEIKARLLKKEIDK
jgi:septum formation topological specificity factor MinE